MNRASPPRGGDLQSAQAYLRDHGVKQFLETRMQEVLMVRPADPIRFMSEAIAKEAQLRMGVHSSPDSPPRQEDGSGSLDGGAKGDGGGGIASIKARIWVQGGVGGEGEREIQFSRMANADMQKGAKGARMLRGWASELSGTVAGMLLGTTPEGDEGGRGVPTSPANHQELAGAPAAVHDAGHGEETSTSPGEAGGQGAEAPAWRFEDRMEDRLPALHESWFQEGAGAQERGSGGDTVAELLIELGLQEGALSGLQGLPFGEFRQRLLREWEIACKSQMLAKSGILRCMAEVLEGGSPDSPLDLLADMGSDQLAEWCAQRVAPELQRVLGVEQQAIRQRRTLVERQRAAGSGAAGNGAGFPSCKFSLPKPDEGKQPGEAKVARFGKIGEFNSGISEKIGLPQVRLRHGMESEHLRRSDSRVAFAVANYGGETTPEREWQCVADPATAAEVSVGDRVVRPLQDLLQEDVVKTAKLTEEEIIALQLYTGPMYMKYNAVLREFPGDVVEGLHGNRYATTITCVVSGIIKLSKLMALPTDRLVYRGLGGLELPDEFKQRDDLGIRGGVEYGLMSTTLDKQVALRYASGNTFPTLLEIRIGAVSRGASIRFLSQYPMESEILYPPMSYLEAWGSSRVDVLEDGRMVRVIPLEVNANVFSSTIEQIIGRRKTLHVSSLEHTVHEIRNALGEKLESEETKERLLGCSYTARGLHHVALAQSIMKEAEEILKYHTERTPEWYNDERNYESAVRDDMELMPSALRKFEYWLENKRSHAEVLSKKSLRWITRRKMSDLNRTLEQQIAGLNQSVATGRVAVHASAQANIGAKETALELCRMRGAVVKVVDEVDVAGDQPLLLAAASGDLVSLRLLVIAGSDIDPRSGHNGATALHRAAFMGWRDCVQFLVEAGCDVASVTNLNETAFYFAAQNGHLSVLQFLREYVGEERCREVAEVITSYGWTSCYVAAWNGHKEALRLLVALGGEGMLEVTTSTGWSCAHAAALNGWSGVLEALEDMDGKQTLLRRNLDGETCAFMACQNGHTQVLEKLIELTGEDWEQHLESTNPERSGWSCLHEAASSGSWPALQVLLDKGGMQLSHLQTKGVTCLVAAILQKDVCLALMSGECSSIPDAVSKANDKRQQQSIRKSRKVCEQLVKESGCELLAVELCEGQTLLQGLLEMGGEGTAIAEELAGWGGEDGMELLGKVRVDCARIL